MKNYIDKTKNLIKNHILTFTILILIIIISNYLFDYYCPSMVIFGIPCPACGISRAIYLLLQLKFVEAFKMNPSIYMAIPLILLYLYFYYNDKDYELLYYPTLFVLIGSIIIFIYRVFTNWGTPPLVFNYNSLLFKIIEGIKRK